MWPEPPSDDYLCNPNDCIPSPPFMSITWKGCETSYYPPQYGYFNLNPEAFGLSYDIFEYKVVDEVVNGTHTLITTGNWESQSSLTEWPKPSPTTKSARALYDRSRRHKYTKDKKACHRHKRDVAPSQCFDICNNAIVIAESIGKSDALCEDGSSFRQVYDDCVNCIKDSSNGNSTGATDFINEKFAQYLNFCSGTKPQKPPTFPFESPEPIVKPQQPTIATSAQADTSRPTFSPFSPTESATEPAHSSPSPSHTTTISSIQVSSAPFSQTAAPSPLPSEQISSIILPVESTGGVSTSQELETSPARVIPSSTSTQNNDRDTASGSRSSSSSVSNIIAGSNAGSGSGTGIATETATASSYGPGSDANGSGTGPKSSASTGNVDPDHAKNAVSSGPAGGNGQVTTTITTTNGTLSGTPPASKSTPTYVTAAASRLSNLPFSAGAMFVSSVLLIMC
ncbi:hypothetical protein ED733_002180 [Metarhizium rileyi]|uniref:Glycoprotein X n=1 Tax=Metarhizium rileyi (strain RCEF 4871) TaxID=1649241 RepID=A0A5C6G8W5_METRR|nr:hypothetical protein ED733_002180 [Metarhizium rileyi]